MAGLVQCSGPQSGNRNPSFINVAFSRLIAGKTVLVIAHRLHTVRNADNIVVMENGCIAEQGRQDALINADGLYVRLWNAGASVST